MIAGAQSSKREGGCAGLPVWRIFVVAVVSVAALVVGVGTASADVIFSDGFESGNFSAWTLVKTGGDGSAVVESSIVKTGSYAAELSESSTSGSKAYVRETFATAQQDLTATGDFQVLQQGASGGNVPFFRFFTSGGTRIISLYRQNVNGKIQVGYGGASFASTGTLALSTWANLQLHVIIAGATSTVQVLLNGTLIYQTTSANLGTSNVSTMQIGNDTAAQAGTIVADNIVAQTSNTGPPANTAPPAISGSAQQGQTLTASSGGWSGVQPISYAYQWQRCDTNGANCANTGSASSTYTLTSADGGSTIVVAVTATNSAGSATAVSTATAVVAASPANTAPPAISGSAQQGQTLTASPGGWSGTQPISYAYQWQRCDTNGANCANAGSASSTYTLTSADVGSTIVVAVTASNSAGSATAPSAPTVVVVGSPPANAAPPAISGSAQQGQTLTASPGNWSGTQPISYAYQWQRCDTNGANCANAGSASSTYTLTSADVGSTIVVAVTASNSAGSGTAVSTATAVVQASPNPLFSDGFESGNFSAWTLVKTGGDGSAVVESSIVKTGSYAAELSESSTSGSKAYVRETFATAQQDLTATGDFQVLQQGASGGNVPFFRFFTSGGTRIISLYRQNVNGKIQVGYGGASFASTGTLALSTWANLQLHVIIAGATSTVQVLLNGTLIYQTTSANLGTSNVSTMQIGNDTAAQAGTIVADNIVAQTSNTGPPANTAPPAISGSAQQGQTLTASSGGWSGVQPISYAYQWQRCDTNGANCANTGSASSTYTLTSADVGSTIVVAVTASNSAGSATAPSAATMVVWTSSVVARWHMDETSGNTMFDSAGQNNGTLNSVTLGLPGFSGNAYGFNGSSSYVSVPSAASLNPGSANFSFTILLQTTGTPPPPPGDWDLIRKGDYTTGGAEYKMEFQRSGQASCGFEGSNGYAEIQAGPVLNDGHWHSITCVKTSSDIELIVDGQTFATSVTIGSISNTAPVLIGTHPGTDWYQGSLDEATIAIGS